nr:unnamed protein product [Spirometra erinaceieuropaei]
MGRPPHRHLQAEYSPTAKQETSSDELAQRPAKISVANEVANGENRWRQLRNTVQSADLAFLGRARRQNQDWFDDNDVVTSNLFTEKNRVYEDYVNRPTDPSKAAFYRSCRLVQQWLQKIPDAWIARMVEEIQKYADRNERKTSALPSRLLTMIQSKEPLLFSSPTKPIFSQKSKSANNCHATPQQTMSLTAWRELARSGTWLPFDGCASTLAGHAGR